ncbi:2-C-methyl-D-erythritol 2,4-cyclodiphosphate synthase [Candidatus Curtissbacteria bacterium RIFCSPHIGHO2_12_FULL_41_17]|uniref:2-C-methyl-D-erythritol 2,4-cyclodiphosphate synthase n=2 Tax=Candidatus Curtissiibacteriota TaxID=1752717 RepID=A0A1F5HNR8_9BACT|nr:MAG: 2-C-methyl-D-erythritol 2,4-cyclodiphosphate synthase [Candidatus Curtissbacteria bacterium RIFCSPHIGHO2_01_FULL_40_12]OGE05774.1 MAG: 2-C-methyl-D-erythritol 2,4-cyclodiphosphate synthase [Candidatus Curtissbacteria bacterium RIFCSPHIGHO2_12_FULL_41_17]
MFRVGIGQDSHRFAKLRKPLILGGVKVSDKGGLRGNSDTDVILHSLCNALSSAIGGDSLSTWSDEMCRRGIKDSQMYVLYIFKKVKREKYKVENVSIALEAKKPYIKLVTVQRIKKNIASLLQVESTQVGITFTSGEGLTSFGRGLGMQAISMVLLSK